MKKQTNTAKDTKVFGFWKYNQFPYVLGAEGRIVPTNKWRGAMLVTAFEADGYDGAQFIGAVVMPLNEGRAIKANLDALAEVYNTTLTAIEKAFVADRDRIFPQWKEKPVS